MIQQIPRKSIKVGDNWIILEDESVYTLRKIFNKYQDKTKDGNITFQQKNI